MEKIKINCRDNGRTPFQWDGSPFSGFSTNKPWIKVNPNYKTVNASIQEKEPNSPLNYFKKIVALRKANPVLVYGKYTLLDKENPSVYAYTRVHEGKKMLVLLNFSTKEAKTTTGINTKNLKLVSTNYSLAPSKNITKTEITLRPYEAVIYKF